MFTIGASRPADRFATVRLVIRRALTTAIAMSLGVAVAAPAVAAGPENFSAAAVSAPAELVLRRHGPTFASVVARSHPPCLAVAPPHPDLGVTGLTLVVDNGSHEREVGRFTRPLEVCVEPVLRLVKGQLRGTLTVQTPSKDPVALAVWRRHRIDQDWCLFSKNDTPSASIGN